MLVRCSFGLLWRMMVAGAAIAIAVFSAGCGGVSLRVSVASDGSPGDDSSLHPSIAIGANRVAFASDADNLLGLNGDTNRARDVFIHDYSVNVNSTICVSIGTDGNTANGPSDKPTANCDASIVAFQSEATNLLLNKTITSPFWQIYSWKKGPSGGIKLLSLSSTCQPGNGDSTCPSSSADGTIVAFVSKATNLTSNTVGPVSNIFVRNICTNQTLLISRGWNCLPANGSSYAPKVSANGRYVSFSSDATNLVPQDQNRLRDIFVCDLCTGKIILVDRTATGVQTFGGDSDKPSISGDGRYVAYQSAATNLTSFTLNGFINIFVTDLCSGQTCLASRGLAVSLAPAIAANSIAAGPSSQFVAADGDSTEPSISTDGKFVAFTSLAKNLVIWFTQPDEVWYSQVYSFDLFCKKTRLVSEDPSQEQIQQALDQLNPDIINALDVDQSVKDKLLTLSPNSSASDIQNCLSDQDIRNVIEAIACDPQVSAQINALLNPPKNQPIQGPTDGTNLLCDLNIPGDGPSYSPSSNCDGRFVAYASDADDLGFDKFLGDDNDATDVFVRDLGCFKVDGEISLTCNPCDFIGKCVYFGCDEEVKTEVATCAKTNYYMQWTNRGNFCETVKLCATPSDPANGLCIKYYTRSGTDITAAITGKGYCVALKPCETFYMYAVVVLGPLAPVDQDFCIKVTGVSLGSIATTQLWWELVNLPMFDVLTIETARIAPSCVKLTSDLDCVQVCKPVKFTATAEDDIDNGGCLEYQYLACKDGIFKTIRCYSPDPCFIWCPPCTGCFTVYVLVREKGSCQFYDVYDCKVIKVTATAPVLGTPPLGAAAITPITTQKATPPPTTPPTTVSMN